jgi:lipid-binding SYLF domain-containing protein
VNPLRIAADPPAAPHDVGTKAAAPARNPKENVIVRLSTFRLAVGLSTAFVALLPASSRAQKDPEVVVGKSLQVLSEITRNPKTGMPRLVMRKAQGIAIIPDMFKMSFIFGARFGRGVLLVRQPDGTWSNPVFLHLLGGSFGAQAGAQSTDLVLVFQTQKGLDRFLKGKGKLTLGVDVAAAAGPVGKRFEASTDAALKAEILSYSNSHGIFAGVSAEGGTLQIDWTANTLYYHQPVSPAAILAINSALAVPPSTLSLQQMLAEKTAWPERIVKGTRSKSEPVIMDDGSSFFDDPDGIEIDGAIRQEPLPAAPANRPRSPAGRSARPRRESSADDDLDALPPPASRKRAPRQGEPQQTNEEDLPEAVPESPPPKAKVGPKPTSPGVDDDLPELAPPKSGSSKAAGSR